MRPRTGWIIFLVALAVGSVWLMTTLIDGAVSHARDIPLYQNARLVTQENRVDPARPPQRETFTTTDSSGQVEVFYRTKFQEQGWTNAPQFIGKVWPVGLNSQNHSFVLSYTRGPTLAIVVGDEANPGTKIEISNYDD